MLETRRPAIERRALALVAVVTAVVYAALLRAPGLIWDDDLMQRHPELGEGSALRR